MLPISPALARQAVVLIFLAIISLAGNALCAYASSPVRCQIKPRRSSTATPTVATVELTLGQAPLISTQVAQSQISSKEWFRKFDRSRRIAELTVQEKHDVNLLVLRSLTGSATQPDNRALTSMLYEVRRKYLCASDQVSRLPALNSELESLRDGYSAYFSAAADLCEECIDTAITEPSNKRRVLALAEQKALIAELGVEFDRADTALRGKYKVGPYNANGPQRTYLAVKKRSRI